MMRKHEDIAQAQGFRIAPGLREDPNSKKEHIDPWSVWAEGRAQDRRLLESAYDLRALVH